MVVRLLSNSPKRCPGAVDRIIPTTVTCLNDADTIALSVDRNLVLTPRASISRQGLARYVNKLWPSPRDVRCTHGARPRRLYTII